MKRYIIVDEFLNEIVEVKARNHKDAALDLIKPQLKLCLSPKLVSAKRISQPKVKGAKRFVDEATEKGWGPGCKFEGQNPEHQIIVTVIER